MDATATPPPKPAEKTSGQNKTVTPTLPPAPEKVPPPIKTAREELDDLAAFDSGRTAKPTTPPKAEAAKPVEQKPAAKPPEKAPAPKPAEKAPETAAEPEGADPDPSQKFQLAHDLRKAYRELYKKNEQQTKELTEYKSRTRNGDDPEKKVLLEQTQAMKKRLEEVEGELRYLDYTKSDEFKTKFEKPFRDAYADVAEEIKEYWVSTPDGERAATPGDFDKIFEAPPQEVRKMAKELFGDSAEDVLSMRRKLVDLRKNADREAKRYREEAADREKRTVTEKAEAEMRARKLWNEANEEIVKRFPQWFGEVEGDDEINQALKDGYSYIDRQTSSDLKMEDRITANAAIRHRAAAFKPMLIRQKRLEARVAELTEALKAYEQSEPGEGSRTGTDADRLSKGAPEFVSAADEIDRLANQDKD